MLITFFSCFYSFHQIFFKKILFVIYFLCSVSYINAQQAILSGENSTSSSGGSVSYAIGNIAYGVSSSVNGSIISGTQIPFEIFIVSSIKNNEVNVDLSVFPNPDYDRLLIKVENFNNENLSFTLYNAEGKILKTEKIKESLTELNFYNIPSGIYLINIKSNNKTIKSFKIVKH